MGLLINDEIEYAIDSAAKEASSSVLVLTGFCKEKAFCNLAEAVNSNVETKRIMVRLLPTDIISGVSDLAVYEQAQKYGWEMYIKFNLHAKVYVFDNSACILGSSNLTSKGMNLSSYGNLETASISNLSYDDIEKLENLFTDAIKMTDDIYSKMKDQIESTDIECSNELMFWNPDILELFQIDLSDLYISDFPSEALDINDFENLEAFEKEHIKSQFTNSNSYAWLKRVLRESENGELYFGQLSEALHNEVSDSPKPYRKEIKSKVEIILNWISILCYEEFIIDTPRYSTRVKLIN